MFDFRNKNTILNPDLVRLLLPLVRKQSGPYSYSPGAHMGPLGACFPTENAQIPFVSGLCPDLLDSSLLKLDSLARFRGRYPRTGKEHKGKNGRERG